MSDNEGLSKNVYFLYRPGLSVALILIGIAVFIWMLFSWTQHGFVNQYDQPLMQTMMKDQTTSPPWLPVLALWYSRLGNIGVGILAGILAIYWLFKHRPKHFYILLVCTLGAFALFMGVVFGFHRPRLHEVGLLSLLPLPSFPSGHVVIAVTIAAFLLWLYLPHVRSASGRAFYIILAILFVLAIGAARLYLGAHYLTDVIAGYGLGLAWIVAALWFSEWAFIRPRG
jgi:undecaprenyl-diphosphatase